MSDILNCDLEKKNDQKREDGDEGEKEEDERDDKEKPKRGKATTFPPGAFKNDKVTVRTRSYRDSKPLVSMYLGAKQKCQVMSGNFKSLDLAGAFMASLAKDVCDGAVSWDNLLQVRDERLRARRRGSM